METGSRAVIFRPSVAADWDRIRPLLVPDPASLLTAGRYLDRLGQREYRREWTWVAEQDAGEPLLTAGVWWGHPDGSQAEALDGIFAPETLSPAVRTGLAAGLMNAAHEAYGRADLAGREDLAGQEGLAGRAGLARRPDFHIFLPGDWRDRPDVIAALAWRRDAARQAGLTASLERLRYEWTPRAGRPDRPGRLAFRPEPDDEVFVQLFRRVLTGTLDTTSRLGASEIGAEQQARLDVAFYRKKMLGERSWWLVAETPDGQVAGFGIPSRNADFPVVGYLGVLPEHRGHGYSGDILAEITDVLVAEASATVIRADTDLVNRPMAAAFDRAGYRNFARRLVLSAS